MSELSTLRGPNLRNLKRKTEVLTMWRLCVVVLLGSYGLASVWCYLSERAEEVFPETAWPEVGSVINNPLVGESIVIIEVESAANQWSSEIEVTLAPGGHVPFAHVHRSYQESFRVVSGRVSVDLGGESVILSKGEVLDGKADASHGPSNPFDQAAIFRVRVANHPYFTPCLMQVHRRLGDASTSWLIRQVRVSRLALACDMYLPTIPTELQMLGAALSAPILRLLGFPVYERVVTLTTNQESNNE